MPVRDTDTVATPLSFRYVDALPKLSSTDNPYSTKVTTREALWKREAMRKRTPSRAEEVEAGAAGAEGAEDGEAEEAWVRMGHRTTRGPERTRDVASLFILYF